MGIYLIRAISTSETKSRASADFILHSTLNKFCFSLTKSEIFVFLSFTKVCLTTNSCIPASFDNSNVEELDFDFNGLIDELLTYSKYEFGENNYNNLEIQNY